tara:strand:- start:2924 stop:3694 length:771 start_codon:yes stop_codon:yes gene_type:complete
MFYLILFSFNFILLLYFLYVTYTTFLLYKQNLNYITTQLINIKNEFVTFRDEINHKLDNDNLYNTFSNKIHNEIQQNNSILEHNFQTTHNSIFTQISNLENRFLFLSDNTFSIFEPFLKESSSYHYELIKKYIEITPQKLVRMMDYYNMRRTLEDIWKELQHKQHYYKVHYNNKELSYFMIYNNNLYKKDIFTNLPIYEHSYLLTKKIDNTVTPFVKSYCHITYNFINGYKNKQPISTAYLEGDEHMKKFIIKKII